MTEQFPNEETLKPFAIFISEIYSGNLSQLKKQLNDAVYHLAAISNEEDPPVYVHATLRELLNFSQILPTLSEKETVDTSELQQILQYISKAYENDILDLCRVFIDTLYILHYSDLDGFVESDVKNACRAVKGTLDALMTGYQQLYNRCYESLL